MNEETDKLKETTKCNIDSVSNSLSDRIFKIATATPFTVDDITDFIFVTGIKIRDMETLAIQLNNCGLADLRDTIVLAKLGYFNYC